LIKREAERGEREREREREREGETERRIVAYLPSFLTLRTTSLVFPIRIAENNVAILPVSCGVDFARVMDDDDDGEPGIEVARSVQTQVDAYDQQSASTPSTR
jgi:hypothetical protein